MIAKKIALFSLLISFAYSGGTVKSLNDKDIFSKSDDNVSLKSSDRDGYMPNIVLTDLEKSGIYGGLGLSSSFLKAQGEELDATHNMANIAVVTGYNINQFLAAEGRALISLDNSKSIDYKTLSLFLKPKYSIETGLDIYSLIGIGKVSANSIAGDDTKVSKTSMQFGVGADYKLENNFKLFADYTYLGEQSGSIYKTKSAKVKSGALTAGITYDF